MARGRKTYPGHVLCQIIDQQILRTLFGFEMPGIDEGHPWIPCAVEYLEVAVVGDVGRHVHIGTGPHGQSDEVRSRSAAHGNTADGHFPGPNHAQGLIVQHMGYRAQKHIKRNSRRQVS